MPLILDCILKLLYTCVHLRSLLRSERALRSQNVRLAFTVRFAFTYRSVRFYSFSFGTPH